MIFSFTESLILVTCAGKLKILKKKGTKLFKSQSCSAYASRPAQLQGQKLQCYTWVNENFVKSTICEYEFTTDLMWLKALCWHGQPALTEEESDPTQRRPFPKSQGPKNWWVLALPPAKGNLTARWALLLRPCGMTVALLRLSASPKPKAVPSIAMRVKRKSRGWLGKRKLFSCK